MKRIEVWGTELALALRAEQDAHLDATLAAQRLEEAHQRVEVIRRKIVSASNEETWMTTDEYDSLPARRSADTEVFQAVQDQPFQDQQCPGAACSFWQQSRAHMHRDGQVYSTRIPGITDVSWEN